MSDFVLTVRQPFAALIILGVKDIENRTWARSHRGKLWIHSSTIPARETTGDDALSVAINKSLRLAGAALLRPEDQKLLGLRGFLLGYVELADIVSGHKSKWAIPGNFHWVLKDPQRIRPRRIVGDRGLWRLNGK